MKKIFALASILVLAGTMAACTTDETETRESTLLTVDINPSVEFIVDEDGTIESYHFLNEDAEIVLAELELEGLNYEEALDLYLEEATELGYIDVDADDNAVFISTSEDEENGEEAENEENLRERVKGKVNEHFQNRGILGAAVEKDLHEEYGELAETYDIGLGQARMIARAVELDEELTMEEAVGMNMGDIMSILRADHQNRMESFREERQEQAKAFRDAMKEEVREKVEAHRSAHENAEENADFDFDEIRDRIQDRGQRDNDHHRNRMEDVKDRARNRMGGHNPFFSDEDEETDEQD